MARPAVHGEFQVSKGYAAEPVSKQHRLNISTLTLTGLPMALALSVFGNLELLQS